MSEECRKVGRLNGTGSVEVFSTLILTKIPFSICEVA